MLGFEIKYGHMVHLGIEVLPGLGCFKQQHVLTDMLNKKITEGGKKISISGLYGHWIQNMIKPHSCYYNVQTGITLLDLHSTKKSRDYLKYSEMY